MTNAIRSICLLVACLGWFQNVLGAPPVRQGRLVFHQPDFFLYNGHEQWRLDTGDFNSFVLEWLQQLEQQPVYVMGTLQEGAIHFAKSSAGGIMFRTQKRSIRFTPTTVTVEGTIQNSAQTGFRPCVKAPLAPAKTRTISLTGPMSDTIRLRQFWQGQGGPRDRYFLARGVFSSATSLELSYITPVRETRPPAMETPPVMMLGTIRPHPNKELQEYVFQLQTGELYLIHPPDWQPPSKFLRNRVIAETIVLQSGRIFLRSENVVSDPTSNINIGRLCLVGPAL